MKILHTADWHVGKRLGRYDRMDDYAAVLDEVVAIAEREAVDLVIVAGDLFDRPTPPIEALRLVLSTLERLANPARPVVAIAGNHDSPALFELLAPLLRSRHVYLRGTIQAPDDGGVFDLETGGGRAMVACLPFLRAGQGVDFMSEADLWHGKYAEKIASLCKSYSDYLEGQPGPAVKLLTGHFMIHGALVGGRGLPRGERQIHLSEAYAAPERAIPEGPQYVAMGHVHAPQQVAGMPVATVFSGSLLELDFGEVGEDKRVVLVEAEPDARPVARSIALTGGRRLMRARGTWEQLLADEALRDVFLDLTVLTEGPDTGVADRARQEFPHLVKAQVDYDRLAEEGPVRAGLPWDELYGDYYRRRHGIEPSEEALAAFREVYAEVTDAST